MSRRIFLVYRRGVSDITARILTEYLQFIEMHMIAASVRTLERDHMVVVLTPATLDRCREPNDRFRQVLEEAQQQHMHLIALASRHFNPADQARHIADFLDSADSFLLDYARFEESLQPVAQLLEVTVELPPLRPEQRVQLDAQDWFERALSLPTEDLAGKLAAYAEAIRIYPNFAEAYARRAGAHLAKGDLETCLADCKVALDLNPNLVEAYHNRAIAQARQAAYVEAVASYSEALRLDPHNSRIHLNRGVAKANLGDIDGAIEDYSAAIALNPSLAEAYFNRSLAHSQRDNFEAALQDYTRAMSLNLDARQAADGASLTATIAYLERMLRRFPDHPQAELVRREIMRLRDLAND
ncbi:MAG: tetratricopeptide repeat protein [Anaerolineae bacterium]|nr:tetratricopeptide repeat protein [Anaerolineae bacterium]MDW8298522.1 tetratricopeptide repeat protein [Anaerolineae bacterium]